MIAYNCLLAVTAATWFAFVYLYEFVFDVSVLTTYQPELICLLLCLLLCLCFIHFAFNWHLRERFIAAVSTAFWICLALVFSNALLTHFHDRTGSFSIWTCFRFHPLVGWQAEPNLSRVGAFAPSVSTDSLGYRNANAYRENGRIPVMVQGDSNLYGYGLNYEETLCYLLNQTLGPGTFYNFGVPGYDLNNYYFQYRLHDASFDIEKRVIFFNVGNDFTMSALRSPSYIRRPYLRVEAGSNSVIGVMENMNRIPKQVYGNHFVERYANYDHLITANISRSWGHFAPAAVGDYPIAVFTVDWIMRRVGRRIHQLLGSAGWLASQEDAFAVDFPDWLLLKIELWPAVYREFARDLTLIMREIARQNSNLTMVLFPMKMQVVENEYRAAVHRLKGKRHGADGPDRFAVNKLMLGVCAQNGIRLVDISADFLAYEGNAVLYQQGDQHLSSRGIAVAAAAIARDY